jgi:myo-inositol catabolism protein IolC
LEHVVKVLCFYHPDDDAGTKASQEDTVRRLFHACRRNRLEMLLEIIPSKVAPTDDQTSAQIIQRFYDLGIYPDWWKLEPFTTDAAWTTPAPPSPGTTRTPAVSSSWAWMPRRRTLRPRWPLRPSSPW